ncbi:MAG: RNA-binding protein [Mariprofundus sp.]|nr:RNA-binding protein [Mariprofundus sp.]
MSLSCFMKLSAAALILSLLGFYSAGIFAEGIPKASILATGLFVGCLIGGLLAALAPKAAATTAKPDNSKTATNETSSNLYVGNLPFNAVQDDIKNLFAPYGEVRDIRMVKDRRSKRFKGYAFIEMNSDAAQAAMLQLNDNEYAGRKLRVNEAQKKEEHNRTA